MRDETGLETLIEDYDIICNNESRRATRLTGDQATSIFILTVTTPELGILDT